MDSTHFFDRIDAWRQNQELPWNHLRYVLVAANLERVIGRAPVRHVLDLGGGDGRDAVPLAVLGHHVTLLDLVPEMLNEAARRAADAGVSARLQTHIADISSGALPVEPNTVDLVLCHNVLQYLAEPERLLRAIATALRPDGWFSLLIPNPASEALRQALQQHDLNAAMESLDAVTHHNQFYDADVRLYELDQLTQLMRDAGLPLQDFFGVRCVNDYINNDTLKFSVEGFARLQALEQAMGRRSPYRNIARLWQLIARKPV